MSKLHSALAIVAAAALVSSVAFAEEVANTATENTATENTAAK